MSSLFIKCILTAGVGLLSACSGAVDLDQELLEDVETVDEPLYGESRHFALPARGQSRTEVKVCWDSLTGNANERAAIQEGAEMWSAATDNWLYFTGWDQECADQPNSHRLYFVTKSATENNCETGGGGVKFLKGASDSYSRMCGSHELGHVIGFQHEHQRFDTEMCPGAKGGSPGDLTIGLPDEDSVMGYCRTQGDPLSEGDIAGARKVFGDGSDVLHNKNYALRFQNRNYSFVYDGDKRNSNRAVSTSSGNRQILRVLREAGAGSLYYGDRIALKQAPFASCTSSLAASPCPNATSDYLCPEADGFGVSTTPCYWTVQRTPLGGGGAKVEINDPFVLKSGNVYLTNEDEREARFTGDFEGTSARLFSGLWLTHDGLPIKADQHTVSAFCREKGYIGGTKNTVWSPSPGPLPPSTMYEFVQNSQTWHAGEWREVASTTNNLAQSIWCRR